MLKKTLLIALTTVPFLLFGQEAAFMQAEYDLANGFYQKAYDGYKKAASEFEFNNSLENYANCNLKMAQCRLAEGKADLCVQLAERTLDYIGDFVSNSQAIQSRALGILGEGNLNLGRNDLALEYFTKEEQFYTGSESLDAAKCYNNLGVVYWNTGNKATALSYHERSLNIKTALLESNNPAIGDSYINIGLIFLSEEDQKAITYFNKALSIYQATYGDQHPKVANCYSNLALAYRNLNQYNEALQYLDLVMGIWESTLAGDHPNKAFTLSNKGRVLELKGDLDESLHYQQLALHQYLRIYGEKHPEVANAYFLIGTIYQKKARFQLAVDHHQASIYANLFTQSYQTPYEQPELREYYNADILLSSLQAKAEALEALHYEKTLKPRDLIGSLDTYQTCDELLTIIRQLRLSEADKLRLGVISQDVYDNGIRIAVELSKRTFKKKVYLNRAFEFCERSKSAILLEAINETKAKSFAGIPDPLLQLEDSLKTEISYLNQKLAQTKEDNGLIKEELFRYQQAYRTFVDQLEKEYPSYFNLKFNQKLVTVPELQVAISDQSAILSYFTGEDIIYVFYISKKKFEVIEKPKASDFLQSAKAFRNSIKYNVIDVFDDSSSKLYEQLIPNLPDDITHLIILPDGILGTLPFEAFTQPNKEYMTGYNSLTYLIENYAVSYDYAASLLIDRLKFTTNTNSNGILLAAPVSFAKNEINMPDLPGSKEEINEIKYLFISSDQKPTTATGEEASEKLIKGKDLSSYKYLHFATHGLVNESKPELSRVFLSPGENEDGSLYSGEIYNLKINADLVTLSACETGLGKIAKGEGIVGLSRSLMYAGAQNLIVSLWQVADASTAELMIDFYKQHLHHSDNTLFNDDLRKAKLKLLNSDNYSSPYYWAPFILVGD